MNGIKADIDTALDTLETLGFTIGNFRLNDGVIYVEVDEMLCTYEEVDAMLDALSYQCFPSRRIPYFQSQTIPSQDFRRIASST